MKHVIIQFSVTDKYAESGEFKRLIDGINNNYCADELQVRIGYKYVDPETLKEIGKEE